MPALTRYTYGAISPLNVEELTYAEVMEYLLALDMYEADLHQQQQEIDKMMNRRR